MKSKTMNLIKAVSVFGISIFLGVNCFSQKSLEYGDFIQSDNSIQWAMETNNYLDLTPKIPKYSITAWYLKKLSKEKQITVYNPEPNGFSFNRYILARKDWNKNVSLDTINYTQLFHDRKNFLSGEQILASKGNCLCDSCYKPFLFDVLQVKQILYYKKGKLNISNVLLSPLCLNGAVAGESDMFTWYRLFNVAYNNKPSLSPTANMVFIGNIDSRYNLSGQITPSDNKRLLTSKTSDLMRMINDDYQKGLFSIYNPNTGKRITNKKYFTQSNDSLTVPTYDSTGTIAGYKIVSPELNLDSFYNFKINQDVWFDPIHEVLISKVKSVTVQKKVITSAGIYLGNSDFATIYYDKPAAVEAKKAKPVRRK